MNILNYEAQQVKDLDEIRNKQKEIMFAFEPNLKQRVEEFDIDIYEDQMLLKEFLLERVVEEITEAYAAIKLATRTEIISEKKDHIEHFKEEIIDVFNFLLETAIIINKPINDDRPVPKGWKLLPHSYSNSPYFTGEDQETLNPDYQYTLAQFGNEEKVFDFDREKFIGGYLLDLIQTIGELTNLLKQRPWRDSQYPVDLLTFENRWYAIWDSFMLLVSNINFTFKEFKAIWSKKYQVNKFRIESNY